MNIAYRFLNDCNVKNRFFYDTILILDFIYNKCGSKQMQLLKNWDFYTWDFLPYFKYSTFISKRLLPAKKTNLYKHRNLLYTLDYRCALSDFPLHLCG